MSDARAVPTHRLRPLLGRDPQEPHRVATPLELLCDLTFAVAFSFAGKGLAHAVSNGYAGAGIAAFSLAMFAVLWAWINFAWFSSAFDNDDWGARLATMVQMLGVLILSLGLEPMFGSVERGAEHLDNRVMVLGYVVMRVALVSQWLRVARHDPGHRHAALSYVVVIMIAQMGWCVLWYLDATLRQFIVAAIFLALVEMAGPWLNERRKATPWHPRHIAERYSLLAIIAIGEIIVGTTSALSAVAAADGWSWQSAMTGVAGVGMALGMWWVYFTLPAGPVLEAEGNRKAFFWGYGHMVVFASIAAVGAGLHVAANALAGAHGVGAAPPTSTALLAVMLPMSIYILAIYALYASLVSRFDPYHTSCC